METPLFDFHCHPAGKPFNSTNRENKSLMPDPDLWRERFRHDEDSVKLPQMLQGEVNFTSQVHLKSLEEGNVRCICLSLYPLERGFTRIATNVDVDKIKNVLDKIFFFDVISDSIVDGLLNPLRHEVFRLLGYLTGFDHERIRDINLGKTTYFKYLEGEYNHLINQQNSSLPYASPAYKVVKSYEEMNDWLSINSSNIAIMLNIEGAHAFAEAPMVNGLAKDMTADDEQQNEAFGQYGEKLLSNIEKVKLEWEVPPFIITFSHHFYNHLAGHAPSMAGVVATLLDQTGSIKDEQTHKDKDFFSLGFRDLGIRALDLMLARNTRGGRSVRRMLIDMKHMSAAARLEYIRYVERRAESGDQIPIISTHTGVSGRKKLEDAIDQPEITSSSSIFNQGSINLFDDEIEAIIRSDGMIGIMMDEKRMVGEKLPGEVHKDAFKIRTPLRNRGKNQTIARMDRARFDTAEEKVAYAKRELKQAVVRYKEAERKLTLNKSRYKDSYIRKLERSKDKAAKEIERRREQVKPVFMAILFNHFFHIVSVWQQTNPEKPEAAWNHICLGSDYEGVINPLDVYFQAKNLKTIEKDLVSYWLTRYKEGKYDKYQKYLFAQPGETIENIIKARVAGILWNNPMRFLKTYYTDAYLSENEQKENT